MYNRLDGALAQLTAIEPTPAFDFEFTRRLDEVIREQQAEPVFDRLARRAVETVRFVLFPKVPALARVSAAVAFLIVFGMLYSSFRPACPLLFSKKGIVLARSAGDIGWRRVDAGEALQVGDTIIAGEDARIDIALEGSYAVRLKGRTRAHIASLTPRRHRGKVLFDLQDGTMLINVEEGFKGSRFIVDTKTARTTALGTKFAVRVLDTAARTTVMSVVEGTIKVRSRHKPEKPLVKQQTVVVRAGQKTEVAPGQVPLTPQRLVEREWQELDELYQLGKKPTVTLLVKNTSDRVTQLLEPCPLYISDEKPREIPRLLDEALLKIEEAIETEDKEKHSESIALLEKLVEEHPNPKYDVQFLLYIGAYNGYLSRHEKAIETFEEVIERYPDSPLASLAQCAIGVIYEERLNDPERAENAYQKVIQRYPNSLEALWVEKRS